jgi:hypothetical protein
MDVLMVAMRIIHILLGVFWAGTIFFVVLYLEPSVRAAGPDGAKVMQGIMDRKFMTVMPTVAFLTIAWGTVILMKLMRVMPDGFMGTPYGISLSVGATAAMVAFIIGITVMRSATLAAGKLMAEINGQPENADNDKKMAQVQALRLKARRGAKSVAHLLAVAVIGMAAARYL